MGELDRMGRSPTQIKELIAQTLAKALPQSLLSGTAVEEIFETLHIYHQELEYQNDELRRVTQKLEEAEEHLRDLYENAPIAYVTYGEDTKIISVNRAFETLVRPAPTIGNRITRFLTPTSQDTFHLHLGALVRSGVAEPCLVNILGEKGIYHLKLDSTLRRRDGTEIRSTFTDLTGELKVESALRTAQARFQAILKYSTEGIVLLDEEARILVWNGRMEEISGLSAESVTGRNLGEVQYRMSRVEERIPEGSQRLKTYAKTYLQNLRDRQVAQTQERVIQRPDGTLRTVEASVFSLPTGEEELFGCLVRDVTDARALEDELAQARKTEAIGLLAGGIAHDFNNLLGIIFGRLEMAKLRPNLSPALEKDLLQIEKAAHHSADMTRQLLTYARKQAVATADLSLNQSIENFLPIARRLVGDGIEVEFFPEPGLPHILLDPGQVDQILTNLCANAKDAISGGGTIEIATQWDPVLDTVTLAVKDNGAGMDENTRAHLFEPFFTTKKLGHGTGLGLATVHGIVYQNHGTIRVESQPGQGSRFLIVLPVYRNSAYLSLPSVPRPLEKTTGHTILVVDDEPEILGYVVETLNSWGYRTLSADSAEQALALVPQAPPIDLLLTDVMLPGKNGRDLALELTLLAPHLRVVFMSGFSGDLIATGGLLPQEVHFLQKPFTSATLQEQVEAVLWAEIDEDQRP